MPAYLVAMVSISDADTYRKYTARTPAVVSRYGGKFIARGGEVLTLEGAPYTDRLVLLEFPSRQAILDFYADPDYQEAVEFRHASSTARFLVIDGAEDTTTPDAKV